MGGKTQTATQQVTIPPEVMARYRAVNQRAETVAAQPFQAYSYDPSAFVAPLTPTQMAGMQNINQAAGMAQPFYGAAAGLTMGGAQGVGPLTQQQIQYYQNPFTQSVVGSTLAGLQQQQGQQLAQQQAEAIRAGAFGGDRAGLQRAQLMGQQNLATAQAISPLMMQGYQQGVQTAMGQQGVLASDLQRQLMAGQQLGGLGAGAQQAALAGAQAQLGAGTAEQQTQQAGLQALYNQFLQERGYPFQVAQFLANIAMGTGALSGSTTTTTQQAPFFSDEDNKKNIRVLGKDPQTGLNVIAYDDADDLRNAREYGEPMPPKRVSYSAQEIEEKAPGLVREIGGNKVVGMANGGAPPFALRGPAMGGGQGLGALQMPQMAGGVPIQAAAYAPTRAPQATGVSLGTPAPRPNIMEFFGRLFGLGRGGPQSMGGLVSRPGSYATGGQVVGSEDMRAILAAIGQPLEFYGGKGLYGGAGKGGAGAPGYVPASQIAQPKLVTAGGLPRPADSGLSQAAQTGSQLASLAKMGKEGYDYLTGNRPGAQGASGKTATVENVAKPSAPDAPKVAGLAGGTPIASAPPADLGLAAAEMPEPDDVMSMFAARGGLMRAHYDLGGALPYATDEVGKDPLQEIGEDDDHKYEMLKPASLPSSGGGGGLGDLANIAKIGATIFSMLPSDERLKDNVEQVGELYDGQPIYRYNMKGSPKTQIGLMAQDVERNGHGDAVAGLGGLKMVDYKRATDVAAGLAGRHGAYRGGYQDGGVPEEEILLAALSDRSDAPRPAGLVLSDADPVGLPQIREPGIVVARRGPEDPGTSPVRSDEGPAPGVVPALPPERIMSAAPSVREAPTGVAPPAAAGTPDRDTVIRDFLSPNRRVESGNRNVPNLAGRSSAFGVHQITEPTWRTIITRHPHLGLTMEDRYKEEAQDIAAPFHAGDLANALERNGLPVTRENLRMSWFLGEAGGPAFLAQMRERPDTPAHTLASPAAVRANPETFFKADGTPRTAQEMYSMMAGQINRAPGVASGQRPERATPGLAGPGRGPMDPASAPFLTLAKRAFGMEGEGTPTQKALTSENFWVPALAGIGTMLASRSPYLAGAVGEGLVGGTKAYTDLQKQQQEMGESRARAEEIVAGISQKAFFEFAGRGMVRYLKPDGTYGAMNFADYFSLPRDKRPPVDPRFQEYLDQIEATYTKGKEPAGGGVSGTTTGTTTQPAAPGVTPEGRPSGVPTTVDLLPQDRTQAFDTARQISLESRSTLEERRKNDFFQPQRALATASQGVAQNTLKLASDILSLPTGQSLATSGKFTSAIGPYVAAMNNFMEVITGRPGAVIDPKILGTQESIEKEINKLRAQVTGDNGQRALGALEEMAKTLVSLGNSTEGQRLILAKVLTDTQRNIDKDRWFAEWIDAGSTAPGGERGAFSDYARLTGQEANREFDRRYGEAFYNEDRKGLGRMMDDRIEGTRGVGGQPLTVFEYIRSNAANLSADHILQLADDYGANTLRYFGIDPNRVEQLRKQVRSPRG